MEFAPPTSSWSSSLLFVLKNPQIGTLKLQSFRLRETHFKPVKLRPAIAIPMSSKRELIDFEERSSPNEIAELFDCTSWTGAGPGLMDAATKGALEAGKPVGGFKIGKEAGEWTTTNYHPYLPTEIYLTCRFFSSRKHGLVDAAMRNSSSDPTAIIALPGGIGTLDEIFEVLMLIQLERIGSNLPVPFLLMNYDSFLSKLLDFLDDSETGGTVAKGEVASLWKVCDNNSEALAYLANFYDIPLPASIRGLQDLETERAIQVN